MRSPGEAGACGGAEFSTEGRSGPGDGCHRGQSNRAGTMHLRLRGGAGVSGVVRETGGRGKVQLTMRECVETSAGSNPSRRAPRVARALFGRKTARGRGITCDTMRRDGRAGRSRPAREARGRAPRAPVAGRKAAPGEGKMIRVRARTVAGVVARAAGAASALDIVVLVRKWGCTPDGVDVETSDASRPCAGAFGRGAGASPRVSF